MSKFTVVLKDRPEEIDNADYTTCCGRKPKVQLWDSRDMISVHCRNPECSNNEVGVLCYKEEAVERWVKFAKEIMSEAFEKGRKAGLTSKLPEETPNPYEEGSLENERWEMGFKVGCKEFNEKMEKRMGYR